MNFRDLYKHIEKHEGPFVPFEFMRKVINDHHMGIGRIDVIYVQHTEPNRQAFYRLTDSDRTSAYEDEFTSAEIVCCDELREHPRERRYACTKELMHAFDTGDQRADSREKFIALMREIQNRPMPEDMSAMYKSELDTRWMAAIALCPRHLRDQYVEQYRRKDIADFNIAEIFRIPEWVAPWVMDEYYDRAFANLIG